MIISEPPPLRQFPGSMFRADAVRNSRGTRRRACCSGVVWPRLAGRSRCGLSLEPTAYLRKCWRTLVTIIRGLKSRAAFKKKLVWLWSSCCHQCLIWLCGVLRRYAASRCRSLTSLLSCGRLVCAGRAQLDGKHGKLGGKLLQVLEGWRLEPKVESRRPLWRPCEGSLTDVSE